MYSPDFADHDPRNPAYATVEAKSVYYISPAQFEDHETPDSAIDSWIKDEGQALKDAKHLAVASGHRVVVEEHIEHDDGSHGLVGSVTVFPWVK